MYHTLSPNAAVQRRHAA